MGRGSEGWGTPSSLVGTREEGCELVCDSLEDVIEVIILLACTPPLLYVWAPCSYSCMAWSACIFLRLSHSFSASGKPFHLTRYCTAPLLVTRLFTTCSTSCSSSPSMMSGGGGE